MDHAAHDRISLARSALQNRVRQLSERLAGRLRMARLKEPLIRRIKAAVYAVAAITLGISAHRLNKTEADLRWRNSHLPSKAAWSIGFSEIGFRPVTNPSIAAKLSRSLPSLTDSSGTIWNADPDWWAILSNEDSFPWIFCSQCDLGNPPKSWRRIGSGWDGWDSAMAEARKEIEKLRKKAPMPIKRAEFVDPREIRY